MLFRSHTFARGNKRLDVEISDVTEIDSIVSDFVSVSNGEGSEPTFVDSEPTIAGELFQTGTEEGPKDRMYFKVYDGFDSYIFINSIYRVPVMYDNLSSDEIFVFEEMNETDVASWARMVLQLRSKDVDDVQIMWALEDMGHIESQVLSYIVTHAEEINTRAENEGWFS